MNRRAVHAIERGMRREVLRAAAQIPPLALIQHHRAHLDALADHFEEDGDHRFHLPRRDPLMDGR